MARLEISDLNVASALGLSDLIITRQSGAIEDKKATGSQLVALVEANADLISNAGDTMTGQLNFSGTDHAGIRLISLTTTERNALTPATGMLIYNETTSNIEGYDGTAWIDLTAASGGGNLSVEEEGTEVVASVERINFVGTSVTVADAGAGEVTVTVTESSPPVDSVNSQTGAVVLDADDIDDTATTNKFATSAQLNAVDGLGSLASLNTVDTAQINDAAVTLAKMANITTDSFIGRTTASTGAPEVLSAGAARTILNVADGATANVGALADLDTVDTAQINDEAITEAKLSATNIPSDNQILSYDQASGGFTWVNDATGGGTLSVEDEGVEAATSVTRLNFAGTGVSAVDAGAGEVTVTIAGGSAPVDSVNGATGAVVLDADDISDAATVNKFVTASDITNLGNLSGTNTGDQTITLTGDVTGTGTGSFTATVTVGAVTQHQAALSITESQISDLGSYITSVVDDTTPQLGGNLDVNGQSIVSVSNGNIAITPNGTGSVVLDGLNWPQADGTNGQVLTTNGSGQLSFTTVSGGSNAINDITDITITTPADNEVLAYNSATSEWINQTPAEAGLAEATHTHATTDITSGTFADARIAQTNVTQHQAALSITESQISDLGSYITASSTETLTNKTFDANGTGNSISNIETADLAAAAKTGADTKVVTGTEGTSGNLAMWNVDGDAVDSTVAADDVVVSDTTGVTGADAVINIMSLTQAEYDAITPNASTLYIITDAA